MKIGILVAMEEEIKLLTEAVSNVSISKIAKQNFYDGYIHNKPVTIVRAGIGKVNASIATTLLIQKFNVNVVINTGSAGAIAKNLSIGDLVISKELAYNDADNREFGYVYGQIPQMPKRYTTNDSLREMIEKVAITQKWSIQSGLILTGDSFISSKQQIEKIKNFFPDALVTEMEGAAVAQTCEQFEISYMVIRAVSDTADGDAAINFDEFVISAGRRSAALVITLIEGLEENIL